MSLVIKELNPPPNPYPQRLQRGRKDEAFSIGFPREREYFFGLGGGGVTRVFFLNFFFSLSLSLSLSPNFSLFFFLSFSPYISIFPHNFLTLFSSSNST